MGPQGAAIDRVEQQIRALKDPRARAVRAVEAHRDARDRALRMTALRRDALIGLHDSGLTWQEVAEVVGMSLKAVTKAAAGPVGAGESWWKRIPESEAGRHKRGPGGIPIDLVIRKEDLMRVSLEVMTAHEAAAAGQGADSAIRPSELRAGVMDAMGRTVAMPSLRAAILAMVEDGTVRKVGLGRYALVRGRAGARAQAAAARR
jgi:hypothetical protein